MNKEVKTWPEFLERLESHFGDRRRLLTNFRDLSQYSHASIQHWRKVNRVPIEAYQHIDTINPLDCVFESFNGFHSEAFTQRVIELSNDNNSLTAIAEILTEEFGSKVSENMVKGVRFRNKSAISTYRTRQ